MLGRVLVGLFCVSVWAADADLAVVEKVAGRVSFYSNAGERLGEVKVGNTPHEAVLSPDGRTLYVSINGVLWMTDVDADGEKLIAAVDVPNRKLKNTIDLGQYRRPHGLSLTKNGMLWSTTEKPDGVLVVDTAKNKVMKWLDTKGQNPHMVEWNERLGRAYVSNTDSGSIAIVNPKDWSVSLIESLKRPQGGVFSADASRFYVVNSGGGSISIIDTSRPAIAANIKTGEGPGRIALTPDGKTLVYNLGTDQAVAFADVASQRQMKVVPIGGRPLSLTLSRDGKRAYAGIQDQDKIIVLSVPDQKIVQAIQLPKGSGPDPVIPLR
jgi:YVTN family beta-propeller protein